MIYFDNAATTLKKPESVYKAVQDVIKRYSANPGRSGHKLSIKASELVYEAREEVARLFGITAPENVIFTYNATYAINFAVKTLITDRCHVIISDLEHNSVLRPVERLRDTLGVEYSVYNSGAKNISEEIEHHIRADTRAIITTLVSNVTGAEIPVQVLSDLKIKHNLLLIVDASQAAGHIPCNLDKCECDAFAAPAHKALFGIMGLGFCIFKSAPSETLIEGGSGSESMSIHMPERLPERLEAGTVALPAICALGAGAKYLNYIGVATVADRIERLCKHMEERLDAIKGIRLYGAKHGIVSFNASEKSPEYISRELDKNGICTRSGLHCAPLAHKTLGTLDGGTVRASLSYFNTEKEIDAFYKVLRNIQ